MGYYFYVRKGNPMIKYHDEPADLHFSNELAKAALGIFSSALILIILSSKADNFQMIGSLAFVALNLIIVSVSLKKFLEGCVDGGILCKRRNDSDKVNGSSGKDDKKHDDIEISKSKIQESQ